MLKPFCDICKSEITAENEGIDCEHMQLKTRVGTIPITILLNDSSTHICKYCIVDGITKSLDDRPRAA